MYGVTHLHLAALGTSFACECPPGVARSARGVGLGADAALILNSLGLLLAHQEAIYKQGITSKAHQMLSIFYISVVGFVTIKILIAVGNSQAQAQNNLAAKGNTRRRATYSSSSSTQKGVARIPQL